MNKIYEISVKKLRRYLQDDDFIWNSNFITLKDIQHNISKGLKETSTPFAHYINSTKRRTDKWHMRRVIYFINHPEQMHPVTIGRDCGVVNGSEKEVPALFDGHHRMLAILYLKRKRVKGVFLDKVFKNIL